MNTNIRVLYPGKVSFLCKLIHNYIDTVHGVFDLTLYGLRTSIKHITLLWKGVVICVCLCVYVPHR